MKYFISLLFLSITFIVNAQIKLQGKVIDINTSKPIPYADIKFTELKISTTTNTDGTFYIESQENPTSFIIAKSGYDTNTVEIEDNINFDLIVYLYPSEDDDNILKNDNQINLNVAIIKGKKKKRLKKKENPAYAILREVWKKKKRNGLDAVPQYNYNEYERIQFDLSNIDSTFMKKKIFKGMEFIFNKIDTSSINGKTYLPAFLNESIYKVSGINKPTKKNRRELEANKTSGFENNVAIANRAKSIFKDINIYNNRLQFLGINFVSPIATDGFAVYDYELKDTLDVDGVESYRIKYFPLRDGEFNFKGDIYISKESYTVKEVVMETTKEINMNFVRNLFVNLQFDIINDSVYYPKKEYAMMDLSLIDKKDRSKGLFVHRNVDYYNFDFEKRFSDNYYDEKIDPAKTALNEQSDEYWEENRPYQLSDNQKGIYETLETLNKVPKFKRIISGVNTIATGYYNINKSIAIGSLYDVFGYNPIEGLRISAGAKTFFTQNDMWRIQGYTAYGFKDSKFKYGIDFRYMFNRFNRFQLGIGTKRDVEQFGSQLISKNNIIARSFASSSLLNQGDNYFLTNNNLTNVYASIEPIKNVLFRADINYQHLKPADQERFSIAFTLDDNQIKNTLNNTSVMFSIEAKPGAKYAQYGLDRNEMYSLAPTFLLQYTKGIKGILNSDFNYDKIQFMYSQPFLIASLGRSIINFEVGKTFQGVPLPLLSPIPGNESYGQRKGLFSQLNYYEFVTDQYLTMQYEHHFNGWILNKIPLIKKLKWREVGFIKGAYGSVSNKSEIINQSNIIYKAPNQNIYYEYGFGLENIGLANIRPVVVNFNWRGNYKKLSDIRRFGITFGLKWNF